MRQANVLHLVNEFADASSNRLILDLMERLDPSKYAIHVGCVMNVEGPLQREFEALATKVIHFAPRRGAVGIVGRIRHYLEKEQIDILHTHVLRADILGGIAAQRTAKTAVLSTKHNMAYPRGHRGWWLKNPLYWQAMRLPDQIITVTDALREQILSRARSDPHAVTSIHSGVDAARYYRPDLRDETRAGLEIAADEVLICYAGRLVGGKGLEALFHALVALRERSLSPKLLVVGEGRLERPLRSLSVRLGLSSQVNFAGFREDIPGILAASDIFLLPSLSEGLPKSILEAMAAGKAVLATEVGGIGEMLENRETGLLVPPGDNAALTGAIAGLVEDEALRQRLGNRARSRAIDAFSLAKMVTGYEAVYQSVLNRGMLRFGNSAISSED